MDTEPKAVQLSQIEMFYLACQVNITVMLPHLLSTCPWELATIVYITDNTW